MLGIVCKIKNNINGKVYIGITSRSLKDRYSGKSWKTSNARLRLVKNAMNKYGEDNFDLIVIENCDVDILEEREKYYISHYNSVSPNGYNLTYGGNYKRTLSMESRLLIS